MALYKIEWLKSAEKEFHNLPKKEKILLIEKVSDLAKNPKPVGSKKLEGDESVYRIRQGNYRVLYRIEKDVLTILIIKVAHRKEVYR
jgi:mRNA interferase RelE/StbE